MLSLVVSAALVALAVGAPQAPHVPHWLNMDGPASTDDILKFQPMTSFDDLWKFFKMEHNKRYAHEVEERVRKEIFAENVKRIEMHNYLHSKGLKSYTLGVNQFSDMEHSEFVKMMGSFRARDSPRGATYMSPLVPPVLPKSVDWRTKGYVTPVKDQGNCGSCWAFSTTGSVEGQMFRKTGKLVSLSEQNLVDCSKQNDGCNGGLMDLAFQYIADNGGIDTEDSYPYVGVKGECQFNSSAVGGRVTGFTDIPMENETLLTEAIATVGPISVAIDADEALQHYKSGIFDEWQCNPKTLNHGVLAVGYGVEGDKEFYIVKNSWSEKWGEKGYIRMSRNKKDQCGIAAKASYPLV